MPIDLGGVFSRLPDPLGLFSGQGNNGVGTGAKSHPVFGDHGPPRGAGRDAGPGQGPGIGHGAGTGQGPGINAGGPQPGGPALQLPPAPPVPVIHHPASPVAVANQVVQHATQTLGGLPGGPAHGPLPVPQSLATATSMLAPAATGLPAATPGTPAFSGGPGQPALPSMGGQGTTASHRPRSPASGRQHDEPRAPRQARNPCRDRRSPARRGRGSCHIPPPIARRRRR